MCIYIPSMYSFLNFLYNLTTKRLSNEVSNGDWETYIQ